MVSPLNRLKGSVVRTRMYALKAYSNLLNLGEFGSLRFRSRPPFYIRFTELNQL